MIKGVILDLGRTLVYFGRSHKEVEHEAISTLVSFLKTNGYILDVQFQTKLQHAREQGWRLAEISHIEQNMVVALQKALRLSNENNLEQNHLLMMGAQIYFEALEQYWQTYPETAEVLKYLKSLDLRLGAISNYENDSIIKKSLERLRISSYLDPIITSAQVKWRKPDPRIFNLISQEWELSSEEIIMIGDSLREDIAGAHYVGMRGILISRGQQRNTDISHYKNLDFEPYATVSSLSEIVELITQI